MVAAPDDVPADVRFDVIWSNPPIRIGKAALHELLAGWLDRLTPAGRVPVVAADDAAGLGMIATMTRPEASA